MEGFDALLVELEDDADPDYEDSQLIVDDEHGAVEDDADHVDDPPATASGPVAPPTPDTPSSSSGNSGDPDDDDNAPGGSCPSCGSEDYFAVDELPDRIIQARPKLREFDRACADCSITDDGRLAPTMEVYAA